MNRLDFLFFFSFNSYKIQVMNFKKPLIYYVSDWFFLYLNPNVKRPWEVINPSQVDAQLLAKVLARCIPPTPPPNTYSVWLSTYSWLLLVWICRLIRICRILYCLAF